MHQIFIVVYEFTNSFKYVPIYMQISFINILWRHKLWRHSNCESHFAPGGVRWDVLALVKTAENPVWYARIEALWDYADIIWLYIKQQLTKELSKDIVCIFQVIYILSIYHYIAANKVLWNKKYYSSYKCCY